MTPPTREPWDAPTLDEVLPPILAACPSFQAVWAERASGEARRGREADLDGYSVCGELSQHLVALVQLGETDEMRPTFEAIERLLAGADSALTELLEVHFIDDLQTWGRYAGGWEFADSFLAWLGPRMREAWKAAFYTWKSDQGLPPTIG